jgi:uncharacterized protein (DUF2236 family)
LHRRHAAVKGQLPWTAGPFPAGSSYCANAVPALRWVYATLIETALIAYELVLPPLTPQQRERYYRESLPYNILHTKIDRLREIIEQVAASKSATFQLPPHDGTT